jgi:hypothetical protein
MVDPCEHDPVIGKVFAKDYVIGPRIRTGSKGGKSGSHARSPRKTAAEVSGLGVTFENLAED